MLSFQGVSYLLLHYEDLQLEVPPQLIMSEPDENTEINTLNAAIADLKVVLAAIQGTQTTVDSGMTAIAGYVAKKSAADGFLVNDSAVENPFHSVLKGPKGQSSSGGGGGGDDGDCCSIL